MKEIIAKYVEPYEIDGVVNKPVWNNLLPLSDCVSGEIPSFLTSFGVANDGENLYFIFKVSDNAIKPIRTKYNSKIYLEEVVEVFISGADIRKYIELEVSPNNTKFCCKIINNMKGSRRLKLLSKCVIDSKVFITDYGYNVEIKASIKAISNKLNIRDLKVSYFNAYRIKRPENSNWELSALSPTGVEGFHYPRSFVKLVMEE